jgi:membrane-associated protein
VSDDRSTDAVIHTALIPWLDPETIIGAAGPWALLVVCFIVFAETGLLVGFLLPGDTLLVISGLLSNSDVVPPNGVFGVPTFVIDDELFWGQDRLDFVARALAA